MELTDAQKQAVVQWVKQGAGLSEIQKRIEQEFGVPMTYMDVRFLVIDLGVQIKDKAPARDAVQDLGGQPARAGRRAPPGARPAAKGVTVEVDRITKPGAVVSGTVTFSDGTTADWLLDQFNRIALDTGQPGYSPPEKDLRTFQEEIMRKLRQSGF